ncbi:mucin-22-like isoform X2 [Aphelocoma coerulescens]|uniref:mucin-22-like isoform X2 n=1 Tax=Aphelocoma coerulescens TaxID=39617 RepID=UPI003604EE6F
MKLLGIASFFLAVLCVCTVGEDGNQTTTVSESTSAVKSTAVPVPVNTTASQAASLAGSVLATASIRAENETITSRPMPSSTGATKQATQGTTTQSPEVTSAANTSFSTTNSLSEAHSMARCITDVIPGPFSLAEVPGLWVPEQHSHLELNLGDREPQDGCCYCYKPVHFVGRATQASGVQLARNESLDAASTMGSFSSTVSTEGSTSASGTSGLPVSSPTSLTTSGNPKSSSGNQTQTGSDIRYSNVILPIVITLIVITLSVFSLVALYKMCQKKTPERQENGAEQAQSDKEGVKLLSVKTTSSETGEHSSHGKNKTRQLFTSQQ